MSRLLKADPQKGLDARRDPTAAALAAEVAKNNPELAQEAAAYFRKQGHLVEIQTEHLHEQRAVNLQLLKIKRFGERLRVGLQVFLILVATVIGIGVAVLIHDAITSRRVVIEPFHAPPNLAARGIDGTVVASGLLDQLGQLQSATRTGFIARNLASAWTNNISLSVPETGISISEISRLLRDRFGHDVLIDGDLIEPLTGGLALTVRGNTVPPKTFEGSATEIQKLTIEAAEYVYSKSQPARWAAYLTNEERYEEAVQFVRTAIASAEPPERPALLNSWGIAIQNTGGSTLEALKFYQAAVKLQPNYWVAHSNVMNSLMMDGDEEGAWRAGEDMRRAAGGRPGGAAETYYVNWDYLTWNLKAWLDSSVADAEANAGVGTYVGSAGPTIADIQARLHDPEAAELALKTTKDDPHDPTIGAMTHFVRGRLAAEAGDAASAAADMEAFGKRCMPIPRCTPIPPGTTAGLRPPRKQRDIRTKPMRCSSPPARSWIATDFTPTSSLVAATGQGRRRRTRRRSRSLRIYLQPTTPGGWRLPDAATWREPNPSSRMQTCAAHTGPIR